MEYNWFIHHTNLKRADHNIAISLNYPHKMAFALKLLFLGSLISHKPIKKCFLRITFSTKAGFYCFILGKNLEEASALSCLRLQCGYGSAFKCKISLFHFRRMMYSTAIENNMQSYKYSDEMEDSATMCGNRRNQKGISQN